jgi:excisionase family DNA binding protein
MADDFESAFKQLLKSVLREVAGELEEALKASTRQQSRQIPADVEFLLSPRETAKRLAISERHLFQLTRSGHLPCVHVGKCVRYSVETIQRWVREAESTEQPSKTERNVSKQASKPEVTSSPRCKGKRPENQKQRGQVRVKASVLEGRSPKVREHVANDGRQEVKNDERVSPLSVLLSELGIERSSLPPITNGDLMRIAQVDVATMHGWLYLNRALPKEAMSKLKHHFCCLKEW